MSRAAHYLLRKAEGPGGPATDTVEAALIATQALLIVALAVFLVVVLVAAVVLVVTATPLYVDVGLAATAAAWWGLYRLARPE